MCWHTEKPKGLDVAGARAFDFTVQGYDLASGKRIMNHVNATGRPTGDSGGCTG
jgi:hypothetical protein